MFNDKPLKLISWLKSYLVNYYLNFRNIIVKSIIKVLNDFDRYTFQNAKNLIDLISKIDLTEKFELIKKGEIQYFTGIETMNAEIYIVAYYHIIELWLNEKEKIIKFLEDNNSLALIEVLLKWLPKNVKQLPEPNENTIKNKITVNCKPAEFAQLFKVLQSKGWITLPNSGEGIANTFLNCFEFENYKPSKKSLGEDFSNQNDNVTLSKKMNYLN